MANTTYIKSQKYAALGTVTVHFNNSTYVSHTITTLGETVFDCNSTRTPVGISLLGQNFSLADLPQPIRYPDGTSGIIDTEEYIGEEQVNPIYIS